MRHAFCSIAWLLVLLAVPAWADEPKEKKTEPKKDAAAQAAPKAGAKGDAAAGADKDDARKGNAKDAKKDDPKKTDGKKGNAGKNTAKPDTRPGLPQTQRPGMGRPGMPGMKPGNANTEKNVRAGVVTGRVTAVMEDKKAVRIEIKLVVAKPNPNAAQSILQAQMSLAQATNPQQILNAQQQMIQARAQLITYETVQKEYELEATENCKVRLAQPPPQFDDKGRVKRYTPAELRALKGDNPRLPGYSGEFGSLRQDQIVQVTLVHKKEVARPRPGGRAQATNAEVDLLADNLPQMSMIVVVHEPKE